MGQKFESELAKKVADGNKGSSGKKKGVLFAAVATCALLLGSAAFSFAMSDNDNGRPVVSLVLTDEVDEVYGDSDGVLDVKRVMNLKARSFLPVGDNGCDEYTKLIYSVNVKILDPEAYDYSGMNVGRLVIGYGAVEDLQTTAVVTVGEVELTEEASAACMSYVFGETTIVDIYLPEGDYADSVEVNFNVSVRIPAWLWSGPIYEYPLPEILGIDDPCFAPGIDWPTEE